jgi:hypothetical protein
MHVFPAGRRLYAALFVGLVVILGAWFSAGVASAQAPPPPGPAGTVVNLCTGGSFDESLGEVAGTLGVTRDELHRAIQTTAQGVAGTQQGANAGTLQQVNTGPSSGLCSAQATPATPSSGTSPAPPPPPGGPPGSGSGQVSGQVTCTGNGSGQPTCTGPGAGSIKCTNGTGPDGRATVTCTSGQPPSPGTPGVCPPRTVEGPQAAGNGPTLVTGQETCNGPAGFGTGGSNTAGAAPVSSSQTVCGSSSSGGMGIVTSSGGSTVVGELTAEGYGTIARNLGRGITGEQVRSAFCSVRR